MASASSSETLGRTKQKGTKRDELDALVLAHQEARRAADRIARLKALRFARDAEAPKEANEATAKANEKPTKRKLRPAKYLGGYE